MKKTLKLLAFFAYILTVIIAGAGAMNYAFVEHEHIYTVFGILNILVGAYIACRYAKENKAL